MENKITELPLDRNVNLCPNCGSDNVLPHEDDSVGVGELPVLIIILTALSVVALYLAFVVTSYMYFPLVVFIAIIITTKMINRQEKKQPRNFKSDNRDFICLNCNNSFRRSGKI